MKFIILATPRSGSTYLRSLLSSHPDITCLGEIFIQKNKKSAPNLYSTFVKRNLSNYLSHFFNPKITISKFLQTISASSKSAFGFKLMISQLEKQPGLLSILLNDNYKIIMLRRKNLLHQYVSLESAKKNNLWHLVQDDPEPKIPSIELHTEGIIEGLKGFEQAYNRMQSLFESKDYIEITYEDLVGDNSQEINDNLCTFLESEPGHHLSSKFKKILPEALDQTLTNYQQIHQCLTGTEYEKYLRK